ncbi:hypothetical protein D047_3314A, partial [Vibrio parahaemolyticus VPTS-2010_2]
MAVEGEIHVL